MWQFIFYVDTTQHFTGQPINLMGVLDIVDSHPTQQEHFYNSYTEN